MKNFLMGCIIVLTALFSCKKREVEMPVAVAKTIDKKSNNVIDTVLNIDSLNFIDVKGSSTLTEAIAQKTLDKYYADKGIHNYDTDFQDEEGNQLCAYYDTIYKYNLNNDNHEDAVIEYHLMPCLAAGHCYLPTYAIITRINGKYKLVSPEFIRNHCILDTIISDKKFNYFYFYNVNCATDSVEARYKAKIHRN